MVTPPQPTDAVQKIHPIHGYIWPEHYSQAPPIWKYDLYSLFERYNSALTKQQPSSWALNILGFPNIKQTYFTFVA
ncbi:hypothetical protein SARC_13166 [Sphaeroforma arctica JP610]|uniref:Uncharacterized protein n=1 Tax=Sphaeroforma arctica JP610 TaxID=667725 RepID=A0A0L0FBY7_9EUKA|nr:hypothetical protein SARC_13166 [Sphaeroforma arctica JP610]KNC74282.1 hypothetical protein SARC_13166 [Sphaeroforma arctica JP610]|eukprot:XP_014148184.1 hypothetical protein SARC_13166 [Sphaeroforma arctica JP610]